MSTSLRAQLETSAKRLQDPATPLEELLKVVSDLRERLEIVHSSEYTHFLHHMFPAFLHLIVTRTKPQFVDNVEHKCVLFAVCCLLFAVCCSPCCV